MVLVRDKCKFIAQISLLAGFLGISLLFASKASAQALGGACSTNGVLAAPAANGNTFLCNGSIWTATMFYSTGTNVGIGTTNPGRTLHVNGPMRLTAGTLPGTPGLGDIAIDSGFGNALRWYNGTGWATAGGGASNAFVQNGNSFGTAAVLGTNDNFNLNFKTNSSVRMTVDNFGYVGIGTTAPKRPVQFSQQNPGGPTYNLLLENRASNNAGSAVLGFSVGINGNSPEPIKAGIAFERTGTDGIGRLHFLVTDQTSTYTVDRVDSKMSISSNGFVGIGTTNPGRILTVAGPIRVAAGTLPGTPAAGDIAIDSGESNALKWYNGTGWVTAGGSAGGITSINGVTAAIQTMIFGTAGTAPAFAITGSTHTLNIPMASTGSVTAGLLSKTDYDSFTAKVNRAGDTMTGNLVMGGRNITGVGTLNLTGSGTLSLRTAGGNYSLTFPTGLGTNGQVMMTDASGNLSWGTVSSGTTGFVQNGNAFGIAAILGTNDNFALNFETNNSIKMSILADGKVGIGTTAPNYQLEVTGATNTLGLFRSTGANNAGIFIDAQSATQQANINFAENGTVRYHMGKQNDGNFFMYDNVSARDFFRVVSGNVILAPFGGNIGIGTGTTSPTRLLQVNGAMRLAAGTLPNVPVAGDIAIDSSLGNALRWYNGTGWQTAGGSSGASNAFVQNGNTFGGAATLGTNDNFALNLETAGSIRMTVTSTGSVGIGTTSPDRVFHVKSGVSSLFERQLASTNQLLTALTVQGTSTGLGTEGHGTAVLFQIRDSSNGETMIAAIGAHRDATAFGNGILSFRTATAGSPAEQMRINPNGFVGIGTSSPASRLHVSAGSLVIDNNQDLVFLGNSGLSNSAKITSTTGNNLQISNTSTTGHVQYAVGSGGSHRFYTQGLAGTERMRIESNGFIGIGTTATLGAVLDVTGAFNLRGVTSSVGTSPFGQGRIYFDSATNKFRVSENGGAYSDLVGGGSSNAFVQNGNAFASQAILGTNDGNNLAFETFGTTRMTITSTGSIGIGTTAPLSKFHVEDTVAAGDVEHRVRNASSTGKAKFVLYNDLNRWFGIELFGSAHSSVGMRDSAALTTYGDLHMGTSTHVQNGGAGKIVFSTGGWDTATQTRMTITSTGSVGIGTGTPNRLLEVSGSGDQYLRVSSTGSKAGLELLSTGAGRDWQVQVDPAGADLLIFRSSDDSFATGTTTAFMKRPTNAMATSTTVGVGSLGMVITRANDTVGEATGIGFAHSSTVTNVGAAITHQITGSTSRGGLHFATKNTTVAADNLPIRMSITDAGNVGIGTVSPNRLLEVAGPMRLTAGTLPTTAGLGDIAIDTGSGNALRWHNGTGWQTAGGGSALGYTPVNRAGDTMTGILDMGGRNISNVGTLSVSAGTATLPSYTFATDSDTGVFLQGTNSLGFATAGTERLRITASDTRFMNQNSIYLLGAMSAVYSPSSASLYTPDMPFIGTSNNTAADGTGAAFSWNVRNTGGTYQSAYMSAISNSSGSAPTIVLGQQTGASSYTERLRITANGNVGIGTTNPVRLLDVAGPMRIAAGTLPSTAGLGDIAIDTGSGNALRWHNGTGWQTAGGGSSSNAFVQNGNSFATQAILGTNDGQNMAFETFGTTRMTITSTGNIGIGTTAPGSTEALHIRRSSGQNTVKQSAGGATSGWIQNTFETHGGAVLYEYQIYGTNWAAVPSYSMLSDWAFTAFDGAAFRTAAQIQVYADTVSAGTVGGFMTFHTSQTERIRIASDGHIGIGVAAPGRLLHVNGPMRLTAGALPGSPGLGDIAIDSGSGNALRWYNGTGWQTAGDSGGAANAFVQNGNAFGTTATLGTNDAFKLSFETNNTVRMTVDLVGDVGIGTAAPGAKLDVVVVNTNGSPLFRTGTSATAGPALRLQHNGGSGREYRIVSTGSSNMVGAGKLEFFDQTAGSARMVIDSVGNLGIGIENPTERLEVTGNIRANGQIFSAMQTVGTSGAPVTAGTLNANNGNSMLIYTGSTANPAITLNNVRPGGSYMVVVHGTGTGAISLTCTNGSPGTTLTNAFVPANGTRTTGTAQKTIYNIVSDGVHCMTTWTTGF